MIAPRLKLIDAEALAVHFKVAVGSIRRWASEDEWTSYGTRRHRLWSLYDAQHSYEKRYPEEGSSC